VGHAPALRDRDAGASDGIPTLARGNEENEEKKPTGVHRVAQRERGENHIKLS